MNEHEHGCAVHYHAHATCTCQALRENAIARAVAMNEKPEAGELIEEPHVIHIDNVTAVIVTRGDSPLLKEIATSCRGFRELIVWDNSQLPQLAHNLLADPSVVAVANRQEDLKVYGRYVAALEAMEDFRTRRSLAAAKRRQDVEEFRILSFAFPDRLAKQIVADAVASTEYDNEPFWVYVQDDDCITFPDRIVAHAEADKVVCNMPEEFRPFYADGIALVGFGAIFDARLIRPAFERWRAEGFSMADDLFLTECDRVFTKLNHVTMVEVPVVSMPFASDPSRLWKRPYHGDYLRIVRSRLAQITGGR